MRYLARRYGEYFGFKIPDVLSVESTEFAHQGIETRKDPVFLSGNIAVVNRINRLNARDFVRTIAELRLRYPDKLIYVPAFGLPNDYPALFYTGVDLLDDSPIRLLGKGRCVSEFGTYRGDDCREKNEEEMRRSLNLIDLALYHNKFRELVETHSFSNFSKEALRIMDMEFYEYVNRFMDYRPKNITASSVEGIYRPEIVNFRKRMEKLRQTADNLLLIPCSAIKPYSQSKTHRILHSFIYPYLGGIQEVIVTSPLGLVPRELEEYFPAKYYDIPVTGHWFEEEKSILRQLSTDYFRRKKYENVFYVLPKGESEIVGLFDNAEGIEGSINFENSERIGKIISSHKLSIDKKRKEKVEYSNVINFLFDIDLEPDRLGHKKEGNRKFVLYNESPILVKTISGVRMTRGLGDLLLSAGKRTVETEGVFKGDNLFIPGIRNITPDVMPGMEVTLVKDGLPVGRGMAEISGEDMLLEKRGVGVSDVSYFQ